MSRYQSKPTTIQKPINEMFDRLNDLSTFETQLKKLPEEYRAKMGDVRFDKDSITIVTPQVGEMKFEVIERQAPDKIVFGSPGSPVPMTMDVILKAIDADSTEITAALDIEIPMMMRPFVGPKLQQAADQFGDMIATFYK